MTRLLATIAACSVWCVAFALPCAAPCRTPQVDARASVAEFLSKALGKVGLDVGAWKVTASDRLAIVRDPSFGTAIVRLSDGLVVSFTDASLALGTNEVRRDPPAEYLDRSALKLRAEAAAVALGKQNLEVEGITIEHDSVSPLGAFERGKSRVDLEVVGGIPFVGFLKPGMVLHFDSATGDILSYRWMDRFELSTDPDRLTIDEALGLARTHASTKWGMRTPHILEWQAGFCFPLAAWADDLPLGGEVRGGTGMRAVRAIKVSFEGDDAPYLCISLVDGAVLEDKNPTRTSVRIGVQ